MVYCSFNETTCGVGIRSLANYKRQHSTRKGTRGTGVIKDEYSHGAESFLEVAQAYFTNKLDTCVGVEGNIEALYRLYMEDK